MENVRSVGNSVVATGLTFNALLVLAGTAGVAFLLEGGIAFAFVAGLLMVRGLFGDNGTVGAALWITALALIIVLLFMKGLAVLVSVLFGLALLALAITKLFDLW